MDCTRSRHADFLPCVQHLPVFLLTYGIFDLATSTTGLCRRLLRRHQNRHGAKPVSWLNHTVSLFPLISLSLNPLFLESTVMWSGQCLLYQPVVQHALYISLMMLPNSIIYMQSRQNPKSSCVLSNSSTQLRNFMDHQ